MIERKPTRPQVERDKINQCVNTEVLRQSVPEDEPFFRDPVPEQSELTPPFLFSFFGDSALG